jgi:hypothetical protein
MSTVIGVTHRAKSTACALMCAMLASCSTSRAPGVADGAAQSDAGADGSSDDAGGAANTGSAAGAVGAAAQSGEADAGSASGTGGEVGSAGTAGVEPPVPSCRLPWYQCPDICSPPLIEGATRTFGECSGNCSFTLQLRPIIVLDEGSCADLYATLTVQNTDGSTWIYEGTLSARTWERLAMLSIDLAGARSALPAVSGCPDCADGGAASVVLGGLDQLTETFAYEYDNPPAALRDADEFLQALIDDLLFCEGSLLESCQAIEQDSDPDADPNAPACTFVYSSGSSAVSCSLPPDTERACATAAACLCQGGILQDAPLDLDACVTSWLTPRGAITFADVCTQGQTDLTETLPSALATFADAYDATVSTSPECDALSAYY